MASDDRNDGSGQEDLYKEIPPSANFFEHWLYDRPRPMDAETLQYVAPPPLDLSETVKVFIGDFDRNFHPTKYGVCFVKYNEQGPSEVTVKWFDGIPTAEHVASMMELK